MKNQGEEKAWIAKIVSKSFEFLKESPSSDKILYAIIVLLFALFIVFSKVWIPLVFFVCVFFLILLMMFRDKENHRHAEKMASFKFSEVDKKVAKARDAHSPSDRKGAAPVKSHKAALGTEAVDANLTSETKAANRNVANRRSAPGSEAGEG